MGSIKQVMDIDKHIKHFVSKLYVESLETVAEHGNLAINVQINILLEKELGILQSKGIIYEGIFTWTNPQLLSVKYRTSKISDISEVEVSLLKDVRDYQLNQILK